jgi:glycosyltransferase involved in cell wall biosynthesis
MKVAIISSTFPSSKRGGVPTYVQGRVVHLSRRVQVQLFALGSANNHDEVSLGSVNNFRLRFIFVWLKLLISLIRFKPDIIEIHSIPVGLPLFLFLKPMYFFHGPARLEARFEGNGEFYCKIVYWLEKFCLKRASKVTTVSKHFGSLILKEHPFLLSSSVKLRKRYPKLVVDSLKSWEKNESSSYIKGQFVCVRRLVKRTGVLMLVESFIMALDQGLNESYKLIIVGRGPLEKKLKQKIEESKWKDNFELLGNIDDAERTKLYLCSQYNIVPTLGYEGFGLVVVEAAFMGCPSMVTNVGALPEVVSTLNDLGVVITSDHSSIVKFFLNVDHAKYPCRKSLSNDSYKKYAVLNNNVTHS